MLAGFMDARRVNNPLLRPDPARFVDRENTPMSTFRGQMRTPTCGAATMLASRNALACILGDNASDCGDNNSPRRCMRACAPIGLRVRTHDGEGNVEHDAKDKLGARAGGARSSARFRQHLPQCARTNPRFMDVRCPGWASERIVPFFARPRAMTAITVHGLTLPTPRFGPATTKPLPSSSARVWKPST